MEGIQTLKGSIVTLTLTLDPAYRRASLIDLYLYTKFHSNRRNFLWTDAVRTYGRTDIFPLSNIIRSTFGSRPNNTTKPVNVTFKNTGNLLAVAGKWFVTVHYVTCILLPNTADYNSNRLFNSQNSVYKKVMSTRLSLFNKTDNVLP